MRYSFLLFWLRAQILARKCFWLTGANCATFICMGVIGDDCDDRDDFSASTFSHANNRSLPILTAS